MSRTAAFFERLSQLNAALDRLIPHFLWIVGGYMMIDAIWLERTTAVIAEQPRAALLLHGFLLFSAGRYGVRWMRQASE